MKKLLSIFMTLFILPWNALAQSVTLSTNWQVPKVESIEVIMGSQASTRLSGGGSIGGFGGGDTEDIRKTAAWFYGNHPIQVCFSKNRLFGLDDKEVHMAAEQAFQVWKSYFASKKINASQNPPVNTNFKFKGKCQGEEDLVLYLGTGPIFQNLQDLKAFQTLVKPVAYVNKTHLSQDLTWAKGYIRFVENDSYQVDDIFYPNWSHKNNFQIMLIHEIGHVLGFKHAPGTIMSSQIVKDLFMSNVESAPQIDGKNELYPCTTCRNTYEIVSFDKSFSFFNEMVLQVSESTIQATSGGNAEKLTVLYTHKQSLPLSLVNVFEPAGSFGELDLMYFVNYRDLALALVLDGPQIKVLKDGQIVALFEKSSR